MSAVVVNVEMQLAISGAELLLLQEQWVVQQGQSVEDIKIELNDRQLQSETRC